MVRWRTFQGSLRLVKRESKRYGSAFLNRCAYVCTDNFVSSCSHIVQIHVHVLLFTVLFLPSLHGFHCLCTVLQEASWALSNVTAGTPEQIAVRALYCAHVYCTLKEGPLHFFCVRS